MQKFGRKFQIGGSMRCWTARSYDNQTVFNRLMLRFRPIAPKPVGGEAASGAAEQSHGLAAGKRVKRKYVRVRSRQSKQRPKRNLKEGKTTPPPEKSVVEDAPPPEKGIVTLQLLEVRSESDKNSSESSARKTDGYLTDRLKGVDGVSYEVTAGNRSVRSVVETWIVVECVTDKFTGVGLGFTDKERICNLERDTCPGFISDWSNKVVWVNEAYRRMVAEDDVAAAAEKGFLVWLVVKEELPHICPSFACRVVVSQQKGKGQKWNKIVPCDVWRLECSGFAWKLDVNTALSLGF